jgi:hypothetical protein
MLVTRPVEVAEPFAEAPPMAKPGTANALPEALALADEPEFAAL